MKKIASLLIITFLFSGTLLAQDIIAFDNLLYGGSANYVIFKPSVNIWITQYSGGVIEYKPENDSILKWYKRSNSVLPSNSINGYAYDADSTLWLSSYHGGVFKFDENDFRHFNSINSPLPQKGIQSIAIDDNDDLFIATRDSGLFVLQADSVWKHYPPGTDDTIHANKIFKVYKGNDGTMYFGTDLGITILKDCKWSYIDLFDPNEHLYTRTYQIFESSLDSLYFLDYNFCYIKKGDHSYSINPQDFGFDSYTFNDVTEDNDRNIYLSCHAGFIRINYSGGVDIFTRDSTPGGQDIQNITGVFFDPYRNKLFFNDPNHAIVFEDEEFTETFCIGCNELPTNSNKALIFDTTDRFWIAASRGFFVKENDGWNKYDGYYNGDKMVQSARGWTYALTSSYVYIFRGSTWELTSVSIWLENDGLYDIAADNSIRAYVATRNGVYVRDTIHFRWNNVGVTERTNNITCDKNGLAWFTQESKIGSFNYSNNEIKYYHPINSDLPPSDGYFGICADSLGRLWLQTDTAIFINENEQWRHILHGFYGYIGNVYVDDYFNTWLVTNHDLVFMNQTDTIFFNAKNAPFAYEYFYSGVPGPDNSFYINSHYGVTTVKYTVLQDVEENIPSEYGKGQLAVVYPNPSNNIVYFKIKDFNNYQQLKHYQIEIFDLLGKSLSKIQSDTQITSWDTSNVKPGIYIYQLKLGTKQSSGKIVVK